MGDPVPMVVVEFFCLFICRFYALHSDKQKKVYSLLNHTVSYITIENYRFLWKTDHFQPLIHQPLDNYVDIIV